MILVHDLDHLEQLNGRAYPAPWRRNIETTSDRRFVGKEHQLLVDLPGDERWVLTMKTGWDAGDTANAELILYLRNNVDDLLHLARVGLQAIEQARDV